MPSRFSYLSRRFFSRVAAVLCALLLVPVAGAASFKIATVSPDGSSWMRIMREGAREVAERTDNRVRFRFYPGGVMGDDHAALRKIRARQLQGAAVTAGVLAQHYKDAQIYSMPMVFRSNEEVDYVRSKMDDLIEEGLKKAGYVTFGLAEGGFAYAMSKQAATSLEQARRQKVWIPSNDPFSNEAMVAFGLNPVPLPIADVLTGLQTELIDAVASPPIATLALQWHTQLNYVLDIPLLYIYGYLALDARQFARISEADQQVVDEVMRAAFNRINEFNRSDHSNAFDALGRQGLELLTPAGADAAMWNTRGVAASERLVEKGIVSEEAWQLMNRHLEDFRSALGEGEETAAADDSESSEAASDS